MPYENKPGEKKINKNNINSNEMCCDKLISCVFIEI